MHRASRITGAAHQFENCPNRRTSIATGKGWTGLWMDLGGIGEAGEKQQQRLGSVWIMGPGQRLVSVRSSMRSMFEFFVFIHFFFHSRFSVTGNFCYRVGILPPLGFDWIPRTMCTRRFMAKMIRMWSTCWTIWRWRAQMWVLAGHLFRNFPFIHVRHFSWTISQPPKCT